MFAINKLSTIFYLVKSNKFTFFLTIIAIFIAFIAIPAYFDNENFNRTLNHRLEAKQFLTNYFLKESESNFIDWSKKQHEYSDDYLNVIQIVDLQEQTTQKIDTLLAKIKQNAAIDFMEVNAINLLSDSIRHSILWAVTASGTPDFDSKLFAFNTKTTGNLSVSQQEQALLLLKSCAIFNVQACIYYFYHKNSNRTAQEKDRHESAIIINHLNRKCGETVEGKLFLGDYTNFSSFSKDNGKTYSNQLYINHEPHRVHFGTVNFVEKQPKIGEHQLIFTLPIENPATGKVSRTRDTFYYEVIKNE